LLRRSLKMKLPFGMNTSLRGQLSMADVAGPPSPM
jgi:hypothetical protein